MSVIPTGVSVLTCRAVGSQSWDDYQGVTIGSLSYLTARPEALVGFTLMPGTRMHQRVLSLLEEDQPSPLALSVLRQGQQGIADHFSGRKPLPYQVLMEHMGDYAGQACVRGSEMMLIVLVNSVVEIGSHLLVIANPVAINLDPQREPRPLVYSSGRYLELAELSAPPPKDS